MMNISSPENFLEGEEGLPNKVRTDDGQLFEDFSQSPQEMPLPPKDQILPPPLLLQEEMPLPPKEQILPPPPIEEEIFPPSSEK